MRKYFISAMVFLLTFPLLAQERKEARIFMCVRNGDLECIKLEIKADRSAIFKKDKNSNTLISLAAISGQNRVLRFLADQWPKWTEFNQYGRNALHEAIIHQQVSTASLILNLAEDDWELDFVRFINTPTLDRNLATPLHLAAIKCQHDIYDLLLQLGADETKLDSNRRNPRALLRLCPPKKKENQKGALDANTRPNTQKHLPDPT